MTTKKKSSSGKFNPNNKDSRLCSSVMFLSWSLVMIWVLFLVYCWNAGLLDQKKVILDKSLSGTETGIKSKADELIGQTSSGGTIPKQLLRTEFPPTTNKVAESSITVSPATSTKDEVHVIFSTDCMPYQDWQTLVIFHSAMRVGQKGKITRIASGCEPVKQGILTNLYKTLYPDGRCSVHFTPDFKKDEKTGKGCTFHLISPFLFWS